MGKYNSLAEFLYLYAAYYTLYALSFAVCGKLFFIYVYSRLILCEKNFISEPLVENFGSLAVSVLTLRKLQTDYIVRICLYIFLSLLIAYYILLISPAFSQLNLIPLYALTTAITKSLLKIKNNL